MKRFEFEAAYRGVPLEPHKGASTFNSRDL